VQTKQFESPSFLPNLDALDAEFERKDEQCPIGRRRRGGASMGLTRPTQSRFPPHPRAAGPCVDAMKPSSFEGDIKRPSFGGRASRALTWFLIIFALGVGTTLALQSYGDVARARIANSSAQLGWVAPQLIVPTTPEAPSAPSGPASPDVQQLALELASMRQLVEELGAQLADGQRQMADDIAKLQAEEHEILQKLSSVPAHSAAAPPPKPAPVSAAAPPRKPARVPASAPPVPSVQEPCGVRRLGDPFSTCFP
jgi:pyruvate/2-oxoglutarate dehydrogenase complex dihydrolipoamide acyltransferase (E2) component